MSGFERANAGDAWTDAEELPFPDDFNLDEAAFAAELRDVFAVERDDMPPLYVQTLLAEERSAAADPGFEYKIVYRVFRRLSLPRPRLIQQGGLGSALVGVRESIATLSRPLVTMVTAAMLFMAVTFMVATPSFAAGLRVLLGQTGVQRVSSYPSNVHSSPTHAETIGQQRNPFAEGAPLYWLGPTFNQFAFSGMLAEQTDFARGAMIDIKYLASVPHGRMTQMDPPVRLDVREFRVSDGYSAVLQVVSETSATRLEVNGQPAVYVDGSWTCYNCKVPVWQSGHRNQLIFERDGVVFWISGDQVEGVDRAMLIAAAAQLAPATISALPDSSVFTQRDGQPLDGRLVTDPAKGEVLALVRSGESPESGPAALYTSPSISQGGH